MELTDFISRICNHSPSLNGCTTSIYIVDSGIDYGLLRRNATLHKAVNYERSFAIRQSHKGTLKIAEYSRQRCQSLHGTHVAAIAHSVSPSATIIDCQMVTKFTDIEERPDRTLSALIKCLHYIMSEHDSGTPGIVNMSIDTQCLVTCLNEDEKATADLILITLQQRLADRGLDSVTAAGNDLETWCGASQSEASEMCSLARSPSTLTVGSCTTNYEIHSFSKTWHNKTTSKPDCYIPSGFYSPLNGDRNKLLLGTSFSNAIASGLVSLIRSQASPIASQRKLASCDLPFLFRRFRENGNGNVDFISFDKLFQYVLNF